MPGLSYDDEEEDRPHEPVYDDNAETMAPPQSTHVPAWLVVFLVLGVIGVLVAGARVLLR